MFMAGKLVQRMWQENDGGSLSRSIFSGVRPQRREAGRCADDLLAMVADEADGQDQSSI